MAQVSIGEAMKMFLNKSPLRNGVRALQIEEQWEKIMGITIAKYTDKIEIVNKTLFVRTHVAALKQELIYQKEKIKERVNEAFGEKIIDNVMVQ
jgi:predicted nucleic acid-binding Zn ribbon protein